jgi:hypothetical protein
MDPEASTVFPVECVYDGSYDEILHLLQAVYWESVEREICELVLAYQEIEKYHTHPIAEEIADIDLDAYNFKQFCKLLSKWSPNSMGSYTANRGSAPYVKGDETFDSAKLHTRATELAKCNQTYLYRIQYEKELKAVCSSSRSQS